MQPEDCCMNCVMEQPSSEKGWIWKDTEKPSYHDDDSVMKQQCPLFFQPAHASAHVMNPAASEVKSDSPNLLAFNPAFSSLVCTSFCVSLSRRMWSVMWTKPFQVVSIVLFNAVVSLSPSLGHWVCLEAVVPSFGVWVRCRRTGQGRKEGTVWMF